MAVKKKEVYNYPPLSLTFERTSGKKYLHCGREVNEEGKIKEFVKSLDTGKIIQMGQIELENFKVG